MSQHNFILSQNDDFPIKTDQPIHSGKVRAVYWLTKEDSQRLIREKGYNVSPDSDLAVMIISDRLSAFECHWKGPNGKNGIPGKGAALNAISAHWFKLFQENNLADSHILDVPHPLVWIVQKAKPLMVEAIARQYITGSMWRSYAKGEREFCGIQIPDHLEKDQKLPELLITPSTKGILKGIPNVPELDDVNITREDIVNNLEAFNFKSADDVNLYEKLLTEGFDLISDELNKVSQIFVDTKFEFGYAKNSNGVERLIYMDEVGTPDSSRIWDKAQYQNGVIVENSKEEFRQALLNFVNEDQKDIIVNKDRMEERTKLAETLRLPQELINSVSKTYLDIAETITGNKISIIDSPREEIISILREQYKLIND